MDILTEIRVWGARHSEEYFWGKSAYTQFAEYIQSGPISLDSGVASLIEYDGPDDDDDNYQDLQLVFEVNDRKFAIDGSYSSWDGTSWNGEPYEVEAQPVQKVSYVRKR